MTVHAVGHLVITASAYGDDLDATRRQTPRTPGGELIWSLLPALTAGVDGFVVSGLIEPRDRVCGDGFDYALSDTTAGLLILDAAGYDAASGLVAAGTVAAFRAARHAGHGLFAQARQIDDTVGALTAGASFVTAVLAERDLASGRLCYVNAGRPASLIMGDGRIVRPLAGAAVRRWGWDPSN